MEEILLELQNITKVYPGGVVANRDICLRVKKGEIHALIGENGAGKSTLMHLIYGILSPTGGRMLWKGEDVRFSSSKDAIEKGIGMVHQHFMLVPSFTAAENLCLGAEPYRFGRFDSKKAIEDTKRLSEKYHFSIDPMERADGMSLAAKQKLEILKALYRGAEFLILDEPTAVLTPQETQELFRELKLLKKQGYTILFISHKLKEVMELADTLTVLRDGRTMGTYEASGMEEEEISRLMVGREVQLFVERQGEPFGDVILRVRGVYGGAHERTRLKDISFTVRQGQILGIAGIEGNGQTELAETIWGVRKASKGSIQLRGEEISRLSVRDRQKKKLSYVSEDRLRYSTAPKMSLEENAISKLYRSPLFSRSLLMDGKKVGLYAKKLLDGFQVKYKTQKDSVSSLSGGNIQKLVFGREFDFDPEVLLLNQPTRGIDVGAIELIRKKIMELKKDGKAILLISADLNEVMALSDSILVMNGGRLTGFIKDASVISEEELGLYMLGVKEDTAERIGEAYDA